MHVKSKALFRSYLVELLLCALVLPLTSAAQAEKANEKSKDKVGVVTAVSPAELALLRKLDDTYQKKAARMSVKKVTKQALLEKTTSEAGTLWISAGQIRMELESDHKSILIVNKKNIWAITYPPAIFKDSKIQVYKADATAKKGQQHGPLTLLSRGGFLKYFLASGAIKSADGSVLFFLSPNQSQSEFKRAEVKVSADGKQLLALNYWDERDNEVRMEFSPSKDAKSDEKPSGKFDDKLFLYDPPSDAEVVNL